MPILIVGLTRLQLTDNQGENLTFVLTLHDGSKYELVVNELQIEMLARAIIHAINNPLETR